jgi:hypothetical protein
MKREPRKVWEKRVHRWERSGLPARAFAAREGVSRSTLTWWRWRLRGGRAAVERPAFVEVEPLVVAKAEVVAPAAGIELVLPDGVRLVVQPGFDGGELRRLLSILEGR